jgi:hypothetical protein
MAHPEHKHLDSNIITIGKLEIPRDILFHISLLKDTEHLATYFPPDITAFNAQIAAEYLEIPRVRQQNITLTAIGYMEYVRLTVGPLIFDLDRDLLNDKLQEHARKNRKRHLINPA